VSTTALEITSIFDYTATTESTIIESSATTLDITAASDLIDISMTSESTPEEDATRSELETDTSK